MPHDPISCPTCGKVHGVPALEEKDEAHCTRCGDVMVHHQPEIVKKALAYALASLVLFIPAQFLNLLNFNFQGQWVENRVTTGAFVLWQQDDPVTGFSVIFAGLLAPLAFNLVLIAACLGLGKKRWDRLARRLWTNLLEVAEWSMLDVYLIALGVSAIKLLGMGDVATRPGLWFVFGFVFTTALTTSVIRPPSIREMLRKLPRAQEADPEPEDSDVACHHCGTLARTDDHACRSCGNPVHEIDIQAMKHRILMLLIAAAALWPAANFLPIMTLTMIGEKSILTVMGGVIYLWTHGDKFPSVIIFAFSVLIPLAKIVILSVILRYLERPPSPALQTKVFKIVKSIGRWSMVDIFVLATLAALGQLGVAATVEPGPAALPFLAIVVLTIFAANSFDSRAFWIHLNDRQAPQTQPQLRTT